MAKSLTGRFSHDPPLARRGWVGSLEMLELRPKETRGEATPVKSGCGTPGYTCP